MNERNLLAHNNGIVGRRKIIKFLFYNMNEHRSEWVYLASFLFIYCGKMKNNLREKIE